MQLGLAFAVFDHAHQHAAFILHGDVFLVDLASGRRVQVTRTPQEESSPRFSADGRALQYRDGNNWYSYDLAGGVAAPAAVLNFAEDPQAKQPDELGDLQLRLFKTLREIKADKQALRDEDKALAAADFAVRGKDGIQFAVLPGSVANATRRLYR